eukprot:TRINITY_DN47_c1_g1_i4.p1 TRINITY_DN47_c1_g1~~TRINITY_DN47_c1_g1_i4.p1  ORF type:complete len:174 (+),score=44.76 TRINITY_DN47_c1_g1_i4:1330-1851(+)
MHKLENIRCIKPIKAGEELFTTYTDNSQPRHVRRKQLARYNFECECEICELTGEALEISEKNRERIAELYETIPRTMQAFRTDSAMRQIKLRMKLAKEEGLDDAAMLHQCYYDGFQGLCFGGRKRESRQWIKKAYENSLASQGPYTASTRRMKMLHDNPNSTPQDGRDECVIM